MTFSTPSTRFSSRASKRTSLRHLALYLLIALAPAGFIQQTLAQPSLDNPHDNPHDNSHDNSHDKHHDIPHGESHGESQRSASADIFETKLEAFKSTNKATINRALISYLSRLDTLRQTMTKRGDLDGVLAVKAEEQRVGTEQQVNASDVVAKPPELNTLMTAFVQGMDAYKKNQQAKFAALIKAERERLQQQISLLTKANRIDEAIEAKTELTAFDQGLRRIFTAARPVKNPITRPVAAGAGGVPIPGTEGLRTDEEGQVDLTMGRGAFRDKKAREDRTRKNPEGKTLGKRAFFDR